MNIDNDILQSRLAKVPSNVKTARCRSCGKWVEGKAYKSHERSLARHKDGGWGSVMSTVWYCVDCFDKTQKKQDDGWLEYYITTAAKLLNKYSAYDDSIIEEKTKETIKDMFYAFRNRSFRTVPGV